MIDLEPLYVYCIDPVVQINDFILVEIDKLRQTLGNNNVLITASTIEKYYEAYVKFDFNVHSRLSYALATFLATRLSDEGRFISYLKIIHQFLEQRELDFSAEVEILLSGLLQWDPFYLQELLSYFLEHRLISKTSRILLNYQYLIN